MTDAQTEARAIARFRIDWEHDDTGYPDLVRVWSDDGPFVSYDDHDAALVAKDADLAEARADALKVGDQMLAEKFRAELAEAQLAEANKALDLAREDILEWVLSFPDANHTKSLEALAAIADARRAREQGGE